MTPSGLAAQFVIRIRRFQSVSMAALKAVETKLIAARIPIEGESDRIFVDYERTQALAFALSAAP
jgi:hypothetical protein